MTGDSNPERGRLRIYLGYAAGVGKTFKMLADAQLERRRGIDIVIAYFEPHRREETIRRAAGIEVVQRRLAEYREHRFEEMDTPAVLARHPEIALVDELAHSNIPGSGKEKRWEDVLDLLSAGITVWTTMNVQHLEGMNDEVFSLTQIRVRETVPDWLLQKADEVVVVDLTPEALLNRLKRGVVYPPEVAARALRNFFQEGNLAALRELTLRHAAHQIESSAAEEGSPAEVPGQAEQTPHRAAGVRPAVHAESTVVLISEDPATAALIRRAKRLADYFHRECLAVYVAPSGTLPEAPAPLRQAIERHLQFARNLQIETRIIQGKDLAASLVEFARRNQTGEIYVLRERPRFWQRILRQSLMQRIVGLAPDLRVTIATRQA